MKRPFLYVYLSISLLHLIAIIYEHNLQFATKPLIMLSLLFYYFKYSINFNISFFIALVFALFGDVFLMWEGFVFFIFGLSCFLAMQFIYTYIFYTKSTSLDKKQLVGIGGIFLFGIGLVSYLYPLLESQFILPVLFYSGSILAMSMMALRRSRDLKNYLPVVMGSLFFVCSDSILAIDKFAHSFSYAGIIIMITYIIAQYIIVTSIAED